MDLGIPAKYNPKVLLEQQSRTWEGLRKFKYQKIIIPKNSAKINSKFYVSELKKLQKRNEKETGIEFVLNDENSYRDFASILNDFHIAKHAYYALDLDKTGHLFAITEYKDQNAKVDSSLSHDVIIVDDGGSENNFKVLNKWIFEKENFLKHSIPQQPKQTFYLISGFFILLCISIFRIKNYL